MIELRWKLGRATKGSPSVPKRLQYRLIVGSSKEPVAHFPDAHEWAGESRYESVWSDWKDVPTAL